MMGRQTGFTIIEVVLFIGISASLFVIGASYMNGTIRNVRFHDSVKGIESTVEKQFTDVQTNAVQRPELPSGMGLECSLDPVTANFTVFTVVPAGDGASNTCIILGVALRFEANNIHIYPVIGTDGVAPGPGPVNQLAATRPTIYDGETNDPLTPRGPTETYELPWQAEWINDTNPARPGRYMNGGAPVYFNTLAFLRSPSSEGVNTYVIEPGYGTDGTVSNAWRGHLRSATSVAARINTSALLCSQTDTSGEDRGAILLDGGRSNTFSISNISSRIAPIDLPLIGGMTCA